ncbi:DUF7455 domain-containing protein [Boudabousia liubingyangii]|nr:hypothetical protein [Boudabousia liubingyangii]
MTMTEEVSQNLEDTRDTDTLSAADRCDACGAQAYVRVQVGDFGELLFCAHHARKHSEALSKVAEVVTDQTSLLQ